MQGIFVKTNLLLFSDHIYHTSGKTPRHTDKMGMLWLFAKIVASNQDAAFDLTRT
jgi:hypothetical protein